MRLSLLIVALVMTLCWALSLRFEPVTYLPALPSAAAAVMTADLSMAYDPAAESPATHPTVTTAPSSQPAEETTLNTP
jgi:hypothetical protein